MEDEESELFAPTTDEEREFEANSSMLARSASEEEDLAKLACGLQK